MISSHVPTEGGLYTFPVLCAKAEARKERSLGSNRAGKNMTTASFPPRNAVQLAQKLQAALACLQGNRLDQADRLLAEILLRMRDQPDALHLKGAVARKRGDHARAVDWFRRSLAVRRDQPAVWNNLGNALSDLGRQQEAIAAYREAVARKPDFADAWINLGIALTETGREEEALAALERAKRFLSPPPLRLLLAEARALKALERLDEARPARARHGICGC